MERIYEELAREFVREPVTVHGVYRTVLKGGELYNGHRRRRTTKSALLIALRGGAQFSFADAQGDLTVYDLSPGSALIGGLNMSLGIRVGRADFEYARVHYLPAAADGDGLRHLHRVARLDFELDSSILELVRKLSAVAAMPGSIELLEKKALFYRLLSRVLASARNRNDSRSGSAMERAVQYIHARYMDTLSLESMAAQCGLKPKYFSCLFRKYTGMSPINYLIQYRMNRAYEMLVSGCFSVREVASSVGYADPYYFSRLFKASKGVAPNDIRMRQSGNNPS